MHYDGVRLVRMLQSAQLSWEQRRQDGIELGSWELVVGIWGFFV